MNDTHRRSLVKAVSWRVIGSLVTSGLVLAFTGKWSLSIGIGALDFILKVGAYYVHERLWIKIGWGSRSD